MNIITRYRERRAAEKALEVEMQKLAHDEQLLPPPEPPMSGEVECTAKRERMRRTSPVEHCGQTGFSPLRTSSSKAVSQALQMMTQLALPHIRRLVLNLVSTCCGPCHLRSH